MFSHLPSYSHNVRLHQLRAQSNDDQGQHLQFIATHLLVLSQSQSELTKQENKFRTNYAQALDCYTGRSDAKY